MRRGHKERVAAEDGLHSRPATPPQATPPRKKGAAAAAAAREWLVVTDAGNSYLEEAGRQSIMRRTGLPARDLRILDPLLSYPSTILGRDRAIVIKLEQIKAIVTAGEVLIPNSRDPAVAPLVQELQSRVLVASAPPHTAMSSAMDREVGNATSSSPPAPAHAGLPGAGTTDSQKEYVPSQIAVSSSELLERSHNSTMDAAVNGGTKVLPFEFRVLEVCLEFACRCLESETSILEKEAYPALDELTSNISTLNLEHVRQIKSRLVAISGRVQKVRDELEHLLDDDMDMAAMYLSEKLSRRASSRFDLDKDTFELGEERYTCEFVDGKPKEGTENSNASLDGLKPNINELEMLLEAYFVQIDGTLNKLSTMREYVDDTEDYINIMLDDKQNQLLQMGVVLGTGTLITSMAVVVVGILGINIHIPIFEAPYSKFWETAGGLISSVVAAYVLAIVLGKKMGFLQ